MFAFFFCLRQVYACWAFFFFLFYRLHEAKAFSSVAQANYFAVRLPRHATCADG